MTLNTYLQPIKYEFLYNVTIDTVLIRDTFVEITIYAIFAVILLCCVLLCSCTCFSYVCIFCYILRCYDILIYYEYVSYVYMSYCEFLERLCGTQVREYILHMPVKTLGSRTHNAHYIEKLVQTYVKLYK